MTTGTRGDADAAANSVRVPVDAEAGERGYLAIRDHAALGDGRTQAPVARDGSVEPALSARLDSPSSSAPCSTRRGAGLAPPALEVRYRAGRRYLAGTDVLETTFTTNEGTVAVLEAPTVPGSGLIPLVGRVAHLAYGALVDGLTALDH